MTNDHDRNTKIHESDTMSDHGSNKSELYDKNNYGKYSGGKGMPNPYGNMNRGDLLQGQSPYHMNRSQSPARGITEDADLSDAMVYLNKIKEEYSDDMVTYDNFLETMRDFKFGKVDAEEVCKAVRVLFKNKPHLIETFNDYLPLHLRFYADRPQEAVVRPFDRQLPPGVPPPQFRRPIYNPQGKIPPHPNMNMGIPPPPMHQQIPMPGHPHLGMQPPNNMHQNFMPAAPRGIPSPMRGMPTQMGKNYYGGFPPQQRTDEIEKVKAKQASEFIQKVKRRYNQHPNIYKTFVELLQTHEAKNTSFERVKGEVNSLLWESPDLCEDFERNFVPAKKPSNSSAKGIFQKIKEVLNEKEVLDDFLKCINYFNQKFINEKDLITLVEPLLRDEQLIKGLKEFLNYKEQPSEELRSYDLLDKVGSYRIFASPIPFDKQSSIALEVLNFYCVCCPTFESEDSNYVFLKRNIHEEALFRIEEERYEADLQLQRIEYFISALEQVYGETSKTELSMKDLNMSPGIVKEILKNVYDKSSSEILEGLLTKPQISIPVVIKRLHIVNKKLREALRAKRRIWREVMERNFRKALDSTGPLFKTSEKSIFSTKNIVMNGEEGIKVEIADQDVLNDVHELFNVYVKVAQTDNKKAAIPNLYPTCDKVFERFNQETWDFVSDFPLFCTFRFIILVYERLLEIKNMNLPPVTSSAVAVKLGYQEEASVTDIYNEVINVSTQFMKKLIDNNAFEDKIRELTRCNGYKLYNLKKMLSKIEKQIIATLDSKDSLDSLYGTHPFPSNEGLLHFKRQGKEIEIKTIRMTEDQEWKDYMEKMKKLDPCEELEIEKPFLLRRFKQPTILGSLKQSLKIHIKPGTYKMKFLAGSESLYVSHDFLSRRNRKLL